MEQSMETTSIDRYYCKDSSIPCYPEVSSGVNAAVSPS